MNFELDYEFLDDTVAAASPPAGRRARASPRSVAAPTQSPVTYNEVDLTRDEEQTQQQGQGGANGVDAHDSQEQQQKPQQEQEEDQDEPIAEEDDNDSQEGLGNVGVCSNGRRKAAVRPSLSAYIIFATVVLMLTGSTALVLWKPVLLSSGRMQQQHTSPIKWSLLFGGPGREQQLKDQVAQLTAKLADAKHAALQKASNTSGVLTDTATNASAAVPEQGVHTINDTTITPAAPDATSLKQLLADQQQQLLDWALSAQGGSPTDTMHPSHAHINDGIHSSSSAGAHQGHRPAGQSAAKVCWRADRDSTSRYIDVLTHLTQTVTRHKANVRRAAAAVTAALQSSLARPHAQMDSRVVPIGASVMPASSRSRALAAAHEAAGRYMSDVWKAEDAAAKAMGATMASLRMRMAEVHVLLGSMGASHALHGTMQSLKNEIDRAIAMLSESIARVENAMSNAEWAGNSAGMESMGGDKYDVAAAAAAALDTAAAEGAALGALHLDLKAARAAVVTLDMVTSAAAAAGPVQEMDAVEGEGGCSCSSDCEQAEAMCQVLMQQLMGM